MKRLTFILLACLTWQTFADEGITPSGHEVDAVRNEFRGALAGQGVAEDTIKNLAATSVSTTILPIRCR